MRILIIKLGAMGDALRTTTILPALKNDRKEYCHITWVSDRKSREVLKYTGLIDRLLVLNSSTRSKLESERFDLVLSFDEAPEAAGLAVSCTAKEKKGFSINQDGALSVFNKASEYALMLGLSDDLKFRKNKKTYPQIIFKMAEMPYRGEEYVLNMPERNEFRTNFLSEHTVRKEEILIGIFTGCGTVFPTKKWSIKGFADLINEIGRHPGLRIILLGGPEEAERNRKIVSLIKTKVIDSGCDNTLKEFINIIGLVDVVVAGDTLAFHLAIAEKKRVVGIFTSTCAGEIELYGRGEIVKAGIECSPCYKKACRSMRCLEAIKPEEVFRAIKRQVEKIGSK